ncbi:Ltp family lipoprotein [Enterococcus saccharolyticus]|uniref:Putative host cell surface-exposed lipoprotein Ltp-like HTH region domain-containing protein n=1 Tax=Enterococcus saccharolyticus subsp. saccharolyticus ATCC 43076 TaxID=1139996 RepID=S0JR80_9ENTE|nr:Ltp family lipoprotein [Enterococcus saccharolyticus]EOT29411.1 hypothetical protein OMQ_01363 [Enterococcus saccharolyticus subsp. saccharolyticus ATCC 43076]EOT81209.1 hypothetical protein I572_01741 [Enterococcus saccharolyticus subsp. saccharolyticus ATCC 43076]OJG88464.1 hypothetical protein RV16_GL000206 [Enterococcus saccharolyticus]
MKLEDILILMGLLGSIYGIVLFIRSLFKKTPKKPGVFIFLGSVLIMLAGGALSNTLESKAMKPTHSHESSQSSSYFFNETTSSTSSPDSNVSREFSNALASAEQYLTFSHLSKDGLYDQLIFDKYPNEAAQYAVDTIQTDWNKHALESANTYLSYSAFSKDNLSSQLLYAKFTDEQIAYALANIDVDWNEQALQSAIQLQSFSPSSDQGLYDQLIYSGFTKEQAEYAIKNLPE